MKRKLPLSQLKVLSVLALIFYFVLILSSLLNGVDDFKLGFAEGSKSAKINSAPTTNFVKIKPKEGFLSFPDTLVNLKTNKTVSIKYDNVALIRADKTPEIEKTVKGYKILSGVTMFLIFVIIVLLPIYYVKIMISMKNGVVFVKENIRWVRFIGELLISYYVLNFIFDWSQFKVNTMLFEFSDYIIVKSSTDFIWLLLGIIVLLFAEVLSKGTILKEEQDLTI